MSQGKDRKEPIDAMSEDLSSLVDSARGGDPSNKELSSLEARLLPLLGPAAGGAAQGGAAQGGAAQGGAAQGGAGTAAASGGSAAAGGSAVTGTAIGKVVVLATVAAGASTALFLAWPDDETPPAEPLPAQVAEPTVEAEEPPPIEEPSVDQLLESSRRTEADVPPVPEEPRPRRPRRPASDTGDDLAEAQLLDRAQRVLDTNPSKALGLVREHAQRFPRGKMRLEREVLRIDALARAGRREAAAAAARRFLAQNPGSAYQERIQALLQSTN